MQGLTAAAPESVAKFGPGYYVPECFYSVLGDAHHGLYSLTDCSAGLVGGLAPVSLASGYLEVVLENSIVAIFAPDTMNTAGWLLTESGRQPWIVQNLMKTTNGVTPLLNSALDWISLVSFVAIYVALGIVMAVLMFRYGINLSTNPRHRSPSPL